MACHLDIYTTNAGGYDIVVLNTGQYQSQVAFEFLVRYIVPRAKLDVAEIQQCAAYEGIAIRLKGHLADRAATKRTLHALLQEALEQIA